MLRFILVIAAVVPLTLVLTPFHILACRYNLRWQRSIPQLYHRIVCALIGVRIHQVGKPLGHQRPVLVLSNHVSWLDICVISAVAPVSFIAKSEVATWPVFGALALGWRGSTRHWRHYEVAYLMLAGLSAPLALCVHSVVSFGFATSLTPGWHTTVLPPHFVAGAIFGGFAMVLQCMIPARAVYKLDNVLTVRHIDVMCKFVLATGALVGYAYGTELFGAWFSGNPYEWQTFKNRAFGGDYAKAGAIMGSIYGLGMIAIWFAPDTTGKKLDD